MGQPFSGSCVHTPSLPLCPAQQISLIRCEYWAGRVKEECHERLEYIDKLIPNQLYNSFKNIIPPGVYLCIFQHLHCCLSRSSTFRVYFGAMTMAVSASLLRYDVRVLLNAEKRRGGEDVRHKVRFRQKLHWVDYRQPEWWSPTAASCGVVSADMDLLYSGKKQIWGKPQPNIIPPHSGSVAPLALSLVLCWSERENVCALCSTPTPIFLRAETLTAAG